MRYHKHTRARHRCGQPQTLQMVLKLRNKLSKPLEQGRH